jgi:hypothetical protein
MAMKRKSLRGSEGPKRSISKPTAAQSMAARKKAGIQKASAEGPKRSVSKPSALAMSVAKGSKPRVVESGVGNVPMTIIRGMRGLASRAGAARAASRGNAASSARSTAAASQKIKKVPVSKSKIEMKGKPTAKAVPYSAKLKTMSSEGPKLSRGKKIGYGSVAGVGAAGAAASRLNISVKPAAQTKGDSKPKKGDTKTLGGRKAIYNGTNWITTK